LERVAHLHLILWRVQLEEPEAPLLPRQPRRALHLAEAVEVGAGIAGCRRCSLDPVDHLVPQIGPAHAVGPEAAERLLSERRAAALPVRRYARLVKHVVCSVVVPPEGLGGEPDVDRRPVVYRARRIVERRALLARRVRSRLVALAS